MKMALLISRKLALDMGPEDAVTMDYIHGVMHRQSPWLLQTIILVSHTSINPPQITTLEFWQDLQFIRISTLQCASSSGEMPVMLFFMSICTQNHQQTINKNEQFM